MISSIHPTYVGKHLITIGRVYIAHSSRQHMATTPLRLRQASVEILWGWWEGCFFRELRKKILEAETAHGSSDSHTRVGQYLWHTIQSHKVMTKFIKSDFHWHTYMEPIVVNQFFKHIYAGVDVDVLKAKIREQDNILTKQEKHVKQIKYIFDSLIYL